MSRTVMILGVVLALAACGDPLSGVPRISEVDLAESDPAAKALPTEAEIAREGFFGTDAARADVPAVSEDAPEPATKAQPRRSGFSGLLGRVLPSARPQPSAPADVLDQDAFDAAKAAENAAEPAPETPVEIASLEPDITTDAPNPLRRTGGLFARLRGGVNEAIHVKKDNMPEVDYGTVLPYGVIARSCASKRQRLGRKVEATNSGHTLLDTKPGTTGPRTFYITGFDDGCPLQLTASHVLLGAPSFYEQLRYGPAGQHLAYGETDKAYEAVKGRVCGTGKGKPCGAKMKQLERDTFFVNAYERPDDNKSWSEKLIHKGSVMATSMKSPG